MSAEIDRGKKNKSARLLKKQVIEDAVVVVVVGKEGGARTETEEGSIYNFTNAPHAQSSQCRNYDMTNSIYCQLVSFLVSTHNFVLM